MYNVYGIILTCYASVWGCQCCMELKFYELEHFTLSPAPTAVHLDLTFDKCMSTCGVQPEVIFVHDPDSDRCECYELPQSLTNVQDGNRMWISGKTSPTLENAILSMEVSCILHYLSWDIYIYIYIIYPVNF